jgi:hypothetical protein
MTSGKRQVVGLFVEGAVQIASGNSIDKLWEAIAAHCGAPVELKVYGIDKSQIVSMRRDLLPKRVGSVQVISSREALDIAIARAVARDKIDRLIIALDATPPNQLLDLFFLGEESTPGPWVPSCLRTEAAFVLDALSKSAEQRFPASFRKAAERQAKRYLDGDALTGRKSLSEVEVLYMEPEFEALLASDEACVLRALGFSHQSRPRDWPAWKGKRRPELAELISRAVRLASPEVAKKVGGGYQQRKSAWGMRIIQSATPGGELWKHPIARRFCRLLHGGT